MVILFSGESSIGRSVDCDLSIETVSLSRKHAVILVEGGTHFVQDNDSRNKTYRGSVSRQMLTGYNFWHNPANGG